MPKQKMTENDTTDATPNLINITFYETHVPIFINGKNLGLKLIPAKITGLMVSYDINRDRIWIEYQGMAGIYDQRGFWIPEEPSVLGYTLQQKLTKPDNRKFASAEESVQAPRTAQVETPMGRVR